MTVGTVFKVCSTVVALGALVILMGLLIRDDNYKRQEQHDEEHACRPAARVASFVDDKRHMSVCAADDGGYIVKEVKAGE